MIDEVSDRLKEVNLIPVSIEPDRAVIAFRDEVNLAEFREAVAAYIKGPRINPKTGEHFKSTKWDVFEYIDVEQLKLWGREDRIGSRLKELIGPESEGIEANQVYVLDIELWHRVTRELAMASLQEVRDFVQAGRQLEGSVLDHFVGEHLCLVRIRASGTLLSQLLDLSAIAEIDLLRSRNSTSPK